MRPRVRAGDGHRRAPRWWRRLCLLSALTTAVSLLVFTTPAAATGSLTALSWSASSSETSASGVSYTFDFTTATSDALISVQMTLPTGSAGTPTLESVSGLPTGGAVTRSSSTLTYTFTTTSVGADTAVSIEIGGIRNTATVGSYTSTITTNDSDGAVDSGTTPALTINGGPLSALSWSTSSTSPGASGVDYTFGFKTRSTDTLVSVTMTVPSGAGGSPAVGTVSGVPGAGAVSLSGDVLTYSFTSTVVRANTVSSIEITGLSNPPSAGSYASTIATDDANGVVDSGTTPSVDFTGTLTGLSWSASSYESADTGVSYTFGFTTASSATLVAATMTLPTGTAGTPSLVSVEGLPAGGTVSRTGTTLNYSFGGTVVSGGTAVSIEVTGLKNTATIGTYSSTVTTDDANGAIDVGTTPTVTITGGPLSGLSWSTSSAATGASGVDYTFGFKTRSDDTLVSVTVTVPAGTGGTPVVGAVSGVPSGGVATLAGNTLTYLFVATEITAGTACSVEFIGLTNTSAAGSYTSSVATDDANGVVDSGTTPSVDFTGTLTGLSWSASSYESADTGVSYTFGFTTASSATLVAATMTLPTGTVGTRHRSSA